MPRAALGVALMMAMACGPGPGSDPAIDSPEPKGGKASHPEAPPPDDPFVRVLGTVQDGGLPHAACDCTRCTAARSEPSRHRKIASLAVCLPSAGRVYLVDATPDLRDQLHGLRGMRRADGGKVDRSPVDGVFLTHAHIGHYLGLAFFGFESVHTRELPVFCTRRMADFLRDNGPWDQLVALDNIRIHEISVGTSVDLEAGVNVTPVAVPHRDEYADTVGFLIEGARSKLLYVPDTDSWDGWSPALRDLVSDVDVAILDGTFFSMDELPGRGVESVGHPLITRTMEMLEEGVREGRLSVYFTHLNHSNPALDPDGDASREMRARGFRVLAEQQTFPL